MICGVVVFLQTTKGNYQTPQTTLRQQGYGWAGDDQKESCPPIQPFRPIYIKKGGVLCSSSVVFATVNKARKTREPRRQKIHTKIIRIRTFNKTWATTTSVPQGYSRDFRREDACASSKIWPRPRRGSAKIKKWNNGISKTSAVVVADRTPPRNRKTSKCRK